MKKKYTRPVLLLILAFFSLVAQAQPGGWNVNPANYQFSMSMVARIETDSMPNNAPNNHVAAFSGNQIRGYATPIQAGGGQVLYFMNLYSNTYLGDKFYFLAYIGDVAKVYESQDTVVFLHHKLAGTIQQPIVLYFSLSPRPLIYSLSDLGYMESNCNPGALVDIEASDDLNSEGNGLKYHIVGGADSSRFQVDSLTGILNWKNFTPDFENPLDADGNNTYLVEVQVTDLAGNKSSQVITVTVKDDPPPSAKCPAAATANTSDDGTGNCTTTVADDLSVIIPANCAIYNINYVLEGATPGQGSGQLPSGQIFAAGKTTVHYTVTDESGTLSSACSFTVTVTDDEAPSVTCPANTAVSTDLDACTAIPPGTAVSVMDNCTSFLVNYTLTGATTGIGAGQIPANQAFLPGITTATYSVTDGSNPAPYTCSFTVTVTDNQAPSVSCPAVISKVLSSGCSSTLTGTAATVSDNCSGFVLMYALSGATTGSGTGQVPGGQKFEAGTTTVVYTATDGDGMGESTCSFTVTITETLKPSVTCPANKNITVGANCQTMLPDYRQVAAISDNCTPDSALLIVQQPPAGTILNGLGATTVHVTATDLSGNSRSCSFTVTITDNPVLEITCPADQQVCNGVIGDYTALALLASSCSGNVPVVMQDPPANTPIATYTGQTTVTLSANDGIRTASCMFTVTWIDTTVPQALCKDISVEIQPDDQATISAAAINNNSTDNCGVQGLSLNTTVFTCSHLGANSVILTVTDNYGLTNTCTATVTVSDPNTYCCAEPAALCKANPEIWLDNNGQAQIAVPDIDNGSSYDCGLQSIGISPAAADCSNLGTPLPVTLTVTDLNNTIRTCVASVMVRDTISPTLDCPDNQVVFADGNCSGAVGAWAPVTKWDNCTPYGSIAVSQSPASNTVWNGHNSGQVVTLTVTDGSNNTATCSFSLTLQDTTAPTVVCKDVTVNLQEIPFVGSQATITAMDVFDSGADNCGGISLGVVPNLFACGNIGNNTVTLTATDQQGYSKTCQATVTVQDAIPPKITCPANQTVSADANCSGMLDIWPPTSKSDNCTPSASIAVSQSPAGNTNLNGHNDARTVTLTATDASGNTADCSFSVTLKDITPPSVTCKNATVVLDNAGTGSITTANVFQSGADNCGTVNQVSVIPNLFNCTHLGTGIVALTVNDGNGNTKSCNATVMVVDTQKPVFTSVPAPVTVQCNAVPGPGTATATDNCSVTIAYNGQTITGGSCPDSYLITRKWTATDGSGNTQTATQRITVQDTQAPVFTSTPAAVTVECSNIPAVGTPAATDNCDAQVTMAYNGQTTVAGTCPDAYILTRKWTATDNCGNTKTATQRITVRDTKAPVFTSTPAAVTVECSNIPTVGTPTATDNCDTQVTITYLGQTTTAGACPDTYVLTRRWRAVDNCNNSKTASQKITVRDLTKPVFTSVPAPVTIECSSPVPTVGTALATDNCDASVTMVYLGQSGTYLNCANSYQLVRSWRATDNCGNWAIATQRITVQDTQTPAFTSVPANVTIQCSSLVPPIGTATATDACAGYVQVTFLGQTSVAGNCPYSYTITRVWRAQDECGNSATASHTIFVQDTQAPTFNNPPPSIMVTCDEIPGVPVLTAQDNCSPATVTYEGQTQTPGDCSTEYSITRTWIATDMCGNVKTLSQTILVMPLPPVAPGGEDRNTSDKPVPVFNIRPNPTTDWVTLDLGDFAGQQLRLAVYDMLGVLVWEQQPEVLREPSVRLSMRQAHLGDGLYTVVLEASGHREVRIIILTH